MMIRRILALLALIATPALSGTTAEVDAWDERCAYVPPRVACLSACAMAWVKSPERRNDGIIGIHRLGREQAGRDYWLLFVVVHAPQWIEHLGTLSQRTSGAVFLTFQRDKPPRLADWRRLKKSGWSIVHTTEEVPRCRR